MKHGVSPEVVHLFREALSDPRSSLLTLPGLGKPIRPWEEPLRATALETTLERFLVDRYREEVARLLYVEALRRQCEDGPERTGYISRSDEPHVGGRMAHVRGFEEETDLIRRSLAGDREITTQVLLRASHALDHSWESEFSLARCYRDDGRNPETDRILGRLETHESPMTRGYALQQRGYISFDDGRFEDARNEYRESVSNTGPRLVSSSNWLVNAILVGDERDAKEALLAINQTGEASEGVLTQQLARLRAVDPFGGSDAQTKDLALSLCQQASGLAAEVASALTV